MWAETLCLAGALAALYLLYMWNRGGVNTHYPDLTGKVVVVTGTNRGFGREVALAFAKLHATVVCLCRHEEAQIRINLYMAHDTGNTNIEFVKCNLLDLASVEQAAKYVVEKYGRVDILVNNAGIMYTPYARSKQNFEAQIATNYLGHAKLTLGLLPALLRADAPRVVSVSSVAHKWTRARDFPLDVQPALYKPARRYFLSKLAVACFIKELAERNPKITAVHCHPGISWTNLWRHFHPTLMAVLSPAFKIFWKTPAEASQTILYCALAPRVESGAYYADCARAAENPVVLDKKVRERLWDEMEVAIGAH